VVTYTVQYTKSAYSDLSVTGLLSNASILEYWEVEQSTSSTVNVSLYWEDADAQGIDQCSPDLVLAHYDGTDWESFGNNGGFTGSCSASGSGTIKVTGITDFSPFTFGSLSSGLNALPIDLISFTADPNGTEVDLDWVTASEINNDYFTIERSADAIEFEAIATVGGAGNSSTILNYKMVDYTPLPGVSYYRLKQTGFDGKFEYSQIEAVSFTGEEEGKPEVLIYPNPVKGENDINVLLSNFPSNLSLNIILNDTRGKEVYTSFINTDEQGVGVENIKTTTILESGIYFVRVIAADLYYTVKLVVY
jgi:hypothetical protein